MKKRFLCFRSNDPDTDKTHSHSFDPSCNLIKTHKLDKWLKSNNFPNVPNKRYRDIHPKITQCNFQCKLVKQLFNPNPRFSLEDLKKWQKFIHTKLDVFRINVLKT